MDLAKTRIGIVGGGVVGRATALAYKALVLEVRIWDIDPRKCTHGSSHLDFGKVLGCDVVFVCLPTPNLTTGFGCDLSALDSFFSSLKGPDHDYTGKTLVLKSTVPIGTTRSLGDRYRLLNLVYSPEFLDSRKAGWDAQTPTRNIVGGSHKEWTGPTDYDTKEVSIGAGEAQLIELYRQRFPHVPIQVMSSDEAEAVKLFQNGIFSTSVALWNELYRLAEKLGLSWETVRQGILADGRISTSHSQVPGPDGKFGFNGKCLPKDIITLIQQYNDADIDCPVLFGAYSRNKEDRPHD